jgi:hypothetical protein
VGHGQSGSRGGGPGSTAAACLGAAPGLGTLVVVGGAAAGVVHASWGCRSGGSGSMVVDVPCLGP